MEAEQETDGGENDFRDHTITSSNRFRMLGLFPLDGILPDQ